MEQYSIGPFMFIRDGQDVDVIYGETSVALFFIPEDYDRQSFIGECEDYYATEMVFA